MTIEIKENESKGFATAKKDNRKVGEMSYSIPNEKFIIIDHTEVDEQNRGEGIGEKLLYKIVIMAREKGFEILPLCPFANAQFKKNPDIRDVLKS